MMRKLVTGMYEIVTIIDLFSFDIIVYITKPLVNQGVYSVYLTLQWPLPTVSTGNTTRVELRVPTY